MSKSAERFEEVLGWWKAAIWMAEHGHHRSSPLTLCWEGNVAIEHLQRKQVVNRLKLVSGGTGAVVLRNVLQKAHTQYLRYQQITNRLEDVKRTDEVLTWLEDLGQKATLSASRYNTLLPDASKQLKSLAENAKLVSQSILRERRLLYVGTGGVLNRVLIDRLFGSDVDRRITQDRQLDTFLSLEIAHLLWFNLQPAGVELSTVTRLTTLFLLCEELVRTDIPAPSRPDAIIPEEARRIALRHKGSGMKIRNLRQAFDRYMSKLDANA